MLTLATKSRNTFGKKVEKDRRSGLVPAVVYGKGEKTSHYYVAANEFTKIWKKAGETGVIKLETEEGERKVLIQDIAVHYITGTPIHIDFYSFQKGMTVNVNIPLRFEGEAPAIKAFNGILVKVMHEIEVEAEPENLPHELIVNVSTLEKLEDRITVKDIKLPVGVKASSSLEEVVALVSQQAVEVEEKEAETLDLTKIEVEKKGKKPVEGEEGAAPAESSKK